MYNYSQGTWFAWLVFCDIIALMFVWMQFYSTVVQVFIGGLQQYLRALWNLIDSAIFILVNASLVARLVYEGYLTRPYDLMVPHFTGMQDIARVRALTVTCEAIAAALAIANLNKFFQLNVHISRVWKTLAQASHRLWATFFVFTVTQVCFAITLYIIYGSGVKEFNGLWESMYSTLFMLGGDVELDKFIEIDRISAYTFLAAFTVIDIMIVSNLTVAVINDAFHYVANAEEEEREWLIAEGRLERGGDRFWKFFFLPQVGECQKPRPAFVDRIIDRVRGAIAK